MEKGMGWDDERLANLHIRVCAPGKRQNTVAVRRSRDILTAPMWKSDSLTLNGTLVGTSLGDLSEVMKSSSASRMLAANRSAYGDVFPSEVRDMADKLDSSSATRIGLFAS